MKLIVKIPTIILLFVFACTKPDDISDVPEIEFKQIQFFGDFNSPDSAWIHFDFKDGDGNLGEDDTTINCVLNYYEKDGQSVKLFPEFKRSYSLPDLTPNASDKAIEGVISIAIKPSPVYNIFSDSLYQWTIQVWDRAGNASNISSTPFLSKKE